MSDQIPVDDDFDEDAAPAPRTTGTVFIDSPDQDDYDENAPQPLAAPSGGYLDRSVNEAIAWGRRQISHPSQNWTLRCQSFVRQCYGVPAWAGSAQSAWDSIPSTQKHWGGTPGNAPRGAAIYFRGGQYGHVMLAIGVTTHVNALSNDYDERGRIDVVPRTIPNWGLDYLGWSAWTKYGSLRLVRPMWDGIVPDLENVRASRYLDHATKATYRVACRLYDLGFYEGKPQPEGVQKYPVNAIKKFQKSHGGKGSGNYGRKTHSLLFNL